jgi:hypothetical protein
LAGRIRRPQPEKNVTFWFWRNAIRWATWRARRRVPDPGRCETWQRSCRLRVRDRNCGSERASGDVVLDRRGLELLIDEFCRVCCVSRRNLLIDIDTTHTAREVKKKSARKQKEAAKKTKTRRSCNPELKQWR